MSVMSTSPYSNQEGRRGLARPGLPAVVRDRSTPPTDHQALEDEHTRVLAYAVGGRLPYELVLRADELARREGVGGGEALIDAFEARAVAVAACTAAPSHVPTSARAVAATLTPAAPHAARSLPDSHADHGALFGDDAVQNPMLRECPMAAPAAPHDGFPEPKGALEVARWRVDGDVGKRGVVD
jgi:hypothetical protein